MPVSLVSPSASLIVMLRSSQVEYDPVAGPRMVKPAVRLQFQSGRCVCPDELWPEVEQHGAYTGLNQPKIMWREDEEARPEAGRSDLDSIQVVSGMQTARGNKSSNAPLQDWDKLSVQEIGKRIKNGEVKDFSNAIAYEAANRKRRMVMRALAEGMAEDAPQKKAASTTKDESVIADSFSAEVANGK